MTAQQENERIARELLGWKKLSGIRWDAGKEGLGPAVCPLFFTDAESGGLILEKLCELDLSPGIVKDPHGRGYACSLDGFPEDFLQPYRTIWLALRAAALQYLDSK